MQNVDCMTVMHEVITQLRGKGAFLTTLAGDDVNTMTIGWAQLGFIWGKPMLTVAVRNTRHTFGIIERAKDFTVSVPQAGMEMQLEFCGTRSGRTSKKAEECGLEMMPGSSVRSPIVMVKGMQFECKIVYKSAMDPKNLIEEYKHLYPDKDYHTLYYGEILECYSTEAGKGK
jgi:flavin reductase (DIM6/NTAB) family NADH-FMN oxidoreductase RutF